MDVAYRDVCVHAKVGTFGTGMFMLWPWCSRWGCLYHGLCILRREYSYHCCGVWGGVSYIIAVVSGTGVFIALWLRQRMLQVLHRDLLTFLLALPFLSALFKEVRMN